MQEKIKDFMDYFTDGYDFPNVAEISFITPKIKITDWGEVYKSENEGIIFEYVANNYLLSHINHVDKIDAYAIHRYVKPSEKDIEEFYKDSMIGIYRDDIIVLAKSQQKHDLDYLLYYFFYFDRDTSDCLIGSFVTTDTQEEVNELFIKWVNETNKLSTINNAQNLGFFDPDDESFKPIKIDLSKVKRWWY